MRPESKIEMLESELRVTKRSSMVMADLFIVQKGLWAEFCEWSIPTTISS